MASQGRKRREIISERIDQTTPAFRVVEACGGLTAFCRDFDYGTSTVYGWLEGGFVPARPRQTPHGQLSHPAWILVRSRELGIKPRLTPAYFIEKVEGFSW